MNHQETTGISLAWVVDGEGLHTGIGYIYTNIPEHSYRLFIYFIVVASVVRFLPNLKVFSPTKKEKKKFFSK